ncbi:MAG: hypothetical protein O9315_17565 [Beijerinckiaceae bacterium]|nr:hypothetical protein [Beijerinckiaceae bacterium]
MYICRTMIAAKGSKDERIVKESDIAALGRVVVLLGEPGIGKTELTKQISASLGALRVDAGAFCRNSNTSQYITPSNNPIIVDGLDEIAASNAEPAIDKVLNRLSGMKNPNVIISCRAADWTGAANRAKFEADYGVAPVPVHILPFNSEQAKLFLTQYGSSIDADQLLSAIKHRNLTALVGNPLTLSLLAEVWLRDAGLPATKVELLDRATQLLCIEDNVAHDQSKQAQASSQSILQSAGCVFAQLLLSGLVGIATNNRRNTPDGFIPLASFNDINLAIDPSTVVRTRLFKPDAEDLMVPVHRIVAEFLAARWLGQKLGENLSERRLFQLLQFNSGVPSALRGLHAWLGFFSPKVRGRCIDADPYGFLRYGETSALEPQSARQLLRALTKLADDDPYFRSEDWSIRATEGLVRPELKAEIVSLITSPQRHIQLSALILESLAGAALTYEILPELMALIQASAAPFVERSAASEALAKSGLTVDWQAVIVELLTQKKHDSWRLAVEIIGDVGPDQFSAEIIADALVALNGLNESERREARVVVSDYKLVARTPIELGKAVLDCIAKRIAERPRARHWHPGRSMTSVIERLLASVIKSGPVDPARFWSWVGRLEGRFGYLSEEKDKIRKYLLADDAFRREVQRLVLYDETIDGGPWMAIVHELSSAISGLAISVDDAAFFLTEIAGTPQPTPHQLSLWEDLVRAFWRRGNVYEKLQASIDKGIQNHQGLGAVFDAITQPPTRDYEAEERTRQQQYEAKRKAKFLAHRAQFNKDLPEIANGNHIGALNSLARAYLDRYSDLPSDADPHARLVEWVGEEVAQAALQGFVAALQREDLPDLAKICSIRTESKVWTAEPVMLAGVSELVRSGKNLEILSQNIACAVLGIWWDMPEFNSTKLGEEIEKSLEKCVFRDNKSAEKFVTTIIEPQLAASKQYVTGLYRLVREPIFRTFSPKLALRWLRKFPSASSNSQSELIQLLLAGGDKTDLNELIAERIATLETLHDDCKDLWVAAAFCVAPSTLASLSQHPKLMAKKLIWSIKSIVLPDRTERAGLALSIERYAAIVEKFAHQWPMVGHPAGAWSGDQNPWDASEFIRYAINAIGNDRTAEGTEALERLEQSLNTTGYRDHIRHVAHEQRRSRRDSEYKIPSMDSVKNILFNSCPQSVADLKNVILDRIADIQKYIKDADTDGCEVFWSADRPKKENTCRDRLIDLLRPRLGGAVEMFPELPMPDKTRVDIYASILGQGLPIEIKGQWHPEIWDASKTQLDERYCRDWRTDGRGIYLVLWFGNVRGKNLPARQNGGVMPSSPNELREELVMSLSEGERGRIEVVVLDVSRPII